MNIRSIIAAAVAFSAIVIGTSASAQVDAARGFAETRLALGITGAVSQNMHSGRFGYINDTADCHCPEFRDGSGVGYQAGVAAHYQLMEAFAIDARAVFDSRPAHFDASLPDALVMTPDGEIVEQKNIAWTDVVYELATMELLLTARVVALPEQLAFTASVGPTIGWVGTGEITQKQQLVSPPDARYSNPLGYETEDNARRLVIARDRPIPGLAATRASIKAGAGVEVGPLASLLLRAGVYYDRGLTSLTTTDDWKVHSVLFQLDVLVEL